MKRNRPCSECGNEVIIVVNGLYTIWECGHMDDSSFSDIVTHLDYKEASKDDN